MKLHELEVANELAIRFISGLRTTALYSYGSDSWL